MKRASSIVRAGLPVALGLVAMLVGLVLLARMVVEERSDARASLRRETQVLRETVRQEWLDALRTAMEDARARIDASRSNPLTTCARCYLVEAGVQILPRTSGPASAVRAIEEYYRELTETSSGASAEPAGWSGDDVEWARRRVLHARCDSADPVIRGAAVESLLDHQGRVILLARQEIASQLALLERCQVPSALFVPLLRAGLQMPKARFLDGLQRAVLRASGKLSAAELRFAADRVATLSRARGVAVDDFVTAVAATERTALSLPHRLVARAVIAPSEVQQWYLEPTADGVRGVAFSSAKLLSEIAATLRRKGLLFDGEQVTALFGAAALAPEDITVVLEAPRFALQARRLDERFVWKTGLLALCAVLGFLVAAFGVALQLRRRREVEAQSRLVAQVSHELRTPLASMRAIAETLQRRTHAMQEVRDYPERLLRDIDGMTFLVDNTLSFNRLTKGTWQPKPGVVALADVVQSAADEARELSPRQVRLHGPAAGKVVRGDPELLRLLFRNLFVNAIAYNRNDPVEVTVEARSRTRGGIEVIVTDNGVGIDPAEWRQVFREYVRGEAGALARGSGLGLALCRTIMRAHDGAISIVRSDATGTSFGVTFP
jgi:two-component system, OmpR family, sensor histidine kinase SenX3